MYCVTSVVFITMISRCKRSTAYTLLIIAILLGSFGISIWVALSSQFAIRDPSIEYCEKNAHLRNRTGSNTTWQNTTITDRYELANMLSSLCFFMTPFILIILYFKKLNALALFYGLYQVVHAMGTFTNHFCGCQPGFMWDNASVWSLLAYMLSVNILALLPRKSCHPSQSDKAKTRHQCRAFMVVSNLCTTALFIGLTFLNTSALEQGIIQGVFFVLLVVFGSIVVATKKVSKTARNMFITSVVLLSVGVTFAIMDNLVCLTPSFGFHVLWHILGGSAMVFYTIFLMDVMIKIG